LPGEWVNNLLTLHDKKYGYYLFSIIELLFGFEKPLLIIRIILNLIRPGIKTIRLRKPHMQFRVRGAMDLWSIKETFLDRFYEKYGYPIQPDWKIIDIGAGIGEYTIYAAALSQPRGQVFAFEPFPESFHIMRENLQMNKLQNVRIFNEAIGAETGELVLDLAGGEPLQFQSHHQKVTDAGTGLSVKSFSLKDALKETGMETCDLLKLDCEGAEYSILFTTLPSTLEHIQRIIMEYHDHATQYTHLDLSRFLDEQGFQVETFPNPVHSHLGYLRAIRKN
jgi:FkbM family methyltransferase